jgi:hypothetical protein
MAATIIVETGTASSTANSYVSVDYADTYHDTYGNTSWPVDAADATVEDIAVNLASKQLALIKATQAVDALYGEDYLSIPTTQTQSLLFPRIAFVINKWQVVSSTTIPACLKDAVCEIALKAITNQNIFPDKNQNSVVKSYTKKMDVMSKQVEFTEAPTDEELEGFYKVELLLAPILEDDDEDACVRFLGR